MNKNVSNQTELQCNANSIIMDIITVREVGEEERNFQFLILNFRDDWALLGTLESCETAVPLFQTEKIRRDFCGFITQPLYNPI